ncbi:MAG TPA: CopG family transcriptional regulator [Gemmatimonadaceae bacterium]|nr:CopG family transcriptional regulator [Gemmatimonadaceae bacterium]
MNKRNPLRLSEPLQIYITADERRMLDNLSAETGLSRAEILRRGLRTFATQQAGDSGPMHELILSLRDAKWPVDIATDHDRHLTDAYTDRHTR